MLYLFVALKLPILAACYVIWWAVHQEPDYDDEARGRRRETAPAPGADAAARPCVAARTGSPLHRPRRASATRGFKSREPRH